MTRQKPKKPELAFSGRRKDAWPVVEGIGLLAAQLGVGEDVIKQVKRNGSKAFLTHNRIDTGILLPELFAALQSRGELPEGIRSPQDWLTTEKAKRETIKRQQDEKSVMLTADAQRQAAEAMSIVFSDMDRDANELPPQLAGLDAIAIFKILKARMERHRVEWKAKFEEMGE